MRKFLSGYPKWLVFALAGLLGAGIFNAGYEFLNLIHVGPFRCLQGCLVPEYGSAVPPSE